MSAPTENSEQPTTVEEAQPQKPEEFMPSTENLKEAIEATIASVEKQLQVTAEESENFINKVKTIETELESTSPAAAPPANAKHHLTPAQAKEVHAIKQQSEELLTRAKGIIFEKTKIIKNQELQIEALTQQVNSLKEVVTITKDLLEIRNMEVEHLKQKMDCMDDKMKVDKERQELMNSKLDKMVRMNIELKSEYEKQLALFIELKGCYEARANATRTLNGESSESA